MGQFFEEKWPWVEASLELRDGLLATVSDADLAFVPGGQNESLGALFRGVGEIERSYIDSFTDLKQDFAYRASDPALDRNVQRLKNWFQTMDDEFKQAIAAVPDGGEQKEILRSTGNSISPSFQVDIYVQAMMIFFGKAIVYFRAMNKPLPPSVEDYIA